MAFPSVLPLGSRQFLVVVSVRDDENRSSAAWLRVSIGDHEVSVDAVSKVPLLEFGELGSFDECGVNITQIEGKPTDLTARYHGWQLRRDGGWWNAIGEARGSLEKGLVRMSRAPTFDRSNDDPFGTAYHFRFQNIDYYCSYERYGDPSTSRNYSYVVKQRSALPSTHSLPFLPHFSDCEAQSRPYLIEDGGVLRMWLSVKGEKYRIRAAERNLKGIWVWSDDAWGLDPRGSDCEVDEVAYAAVFEDQGSLFMMFNGDGHGREGIGVAKWAR